MKPIPNELILCLWRALLGEIYCSIRAVVVSFSDGRVLKIRYYLDRVPTDLDMESLEVVATNISSSPYANEISSIELESRFDSGPIGKLDYLDGFIYCRREHDL